MAGFVNTVELAILDHFVGNTPWVAPSALHVGLSSSTPLDDGTGITEPSTGSYARVTTDDTNWATATGTAPASVANSTVITFPAATADWVSGQNLTHFVLFDAATLGNPVAFGALTTPKPVLSGDTASFAIGALVLQLGDPVDFP